MTDYMTRGWLPVATPPPVTESEFGWPSSVPVLGYFRDGRQRIVTFEVYDDDYRIPTWYTTCSERWNVTGKVTHWMPLPPPPAKDTDET